MKMMLRFFSILLLMPLMLSLTTSAAQEATDGAVSRGAFLTTRKTATTSSPRKNPRRTKTQTAQSKPEAQKSAALALGYTVFRRDENDSARRAEASQIFRAGDGVRLMIEANTDGYLYVFHTEDGRNPQMLFPDVRLNGGNNRIAAHVPYEIPSRREADARFRWFYFDNNAATERLYVVITKQPLPGVPAGQQLIALCSSAKETGCAWKPEPTPWQQLVSRTPAGIPAETARDSGQQESAVETDAITRGISLSADAPAPTRITFSKQPGADRLLVIIDLIHQ